MCTKLLPDLLIPSIEAQEETLNIERVKIITKEVRFYLNSDEFKKAFDV